MTPNPNFDLFARPQEPERPLHVSELNDRAAALLEGKFARVLVEGEVSGFLAHRSGHWYFTLKDSHGQVSCCCFKNSQKGAQAPRDGDKVVVRGKLTIYAQRGSYQLVVDQVRPAGAGVLLQKLEALKQKLAEEGLLDSERKRELPRIIHNVGIVTSPDGAAVKDFIRVARERDPTLRVLVLPTPVQGAGAANEIARMIRYASTRASELRLDVLVIARGGGSIEDLWAFNEEIVARAIADCRIPTVSAIGHEVDVTIADLVADVRAPTPTAAAQLTAADMRAVRAAFTDQGRRLVRLIRGDVQARLARLQRARLTLQDPMRRLQRLRQRIDLLAEDLERSLRGRLATGEQRLQRARAIIEAHHPQKTIASSARRLATLERRMQQAMASRLHDRKAKLGRVAARLDALSPLGVLSRGYAIALNEGIAVRAPGDAPVGTKLQIRLHEGEIAARVIDQKEK
ncbi:MAG: exodeoxyribonuclease VII large subunit [Deltaproteobacteria bacterium]|nr:exodeoxyribonuclease VII large subunit [Deltaproteobacteria bacterium]